MVYLKYNTADNVVQDSVVSRIILEIDPVLLQVMDGVALDGVANGVRDPNPTLTVPDMVV